MNSALPEEKGLTSAEVADRVAAGQVNRLPKDSWRDYAEIVRRNTLTLFNALVVPAAIALFLLGDYRGAIAVSGMALANSAIGLTHELRAKRYLDRLSLLSESRVRVRREGQEQILSSGDVVAEELILLSTGDTVVADGVVIAASFLEIDEALLTGESDPIQRQAGDELKSGSVCLTGEGMYRAVRVGREAFAQQTTTAARHYRHTPSPTQRSLDQLVKWLTALAIALCLGYVGLYFIRGFTSTELVQMMAATITSMVPQGLVLLTTLVFVITASRLSGTGALVQRLAAVEGLAAIDVLCMDKTGTLTTGSQMLDHLVVFSEPEAAVKGLLGAFASASVDRRNKGIEALQASLAVGAYAFEVHDQLPFQSQNRCSAMVVEINSQTRLLVLGSFEVLQSHFDESNRGKVEAAWRELIPTGLRMIVFADGGVSSQPLAGRVPDVPLRPLALVALRDELRPRVLDVLKALALQGIRFKVISGDHPETVLATVRALDSIILGNSIIAGDRWAEAADRSALAEQCSIFGRVSPEQKLALIETLQKSGSNVGMIGDGVNDILPIKRADFGVAMGAGSQATKAVAGVVLESNDFALLPVVLTEGRRVVGNIRRAAKLFLLKNVYTVIVILVGVGIAGVPFPYLPQQVTLLNILTIGGPAVLILASRTSAPRAIKLSFLADVGRFVLVAGIATSICGLGIYLGSVLQFHTAIETARTRMLAMLILAGLGNAIVATSGDRRLIAWGILAVGVLLGCMFITPVAYFFALVVLSVEDWLIVIVAAICAVIPTTLLGG